MSEYRPAYCSATRAATSANPHARRVVPSLPLDGAVPKRLFTPAEANSALVAVSPPAERLVALRTRMRKLVDEQSDLVLSIGGNGGGYAAGDLNAAQAQLEHLAEEAGSAVAELEALGVVVKDLDLGLLDFPSLRNGEEVELCWCVGEEHVEQWHGLGEGFAGRKPIDWVE